VYFASNPTAFKVQAGSLAPGLKDDGDKQQHSVTAAFNITLLYHAKE
jgi:hypothetical protein